jgi:hypothetical protein
MLVSVAQLTTLTAFKILTLAKIATLNLSSVIKPAIHSLLIQGQPEEVFACMPTSVAFKFFLPQNIA